LTHRITQATTVLITLLCPPSSTQSLNGKDNTTSLISLICLLDINFNRDENGLIKDNLIIKGNNLLALHTLKSNFAGKVKLIYIDPPYNTGNDSFNYNDTNLCISVYS
jgi:hypothetical protein